MGSGSSPAIAQIPQVHLPFKLLHQDFLYCLRSRTHSPLIYKLSHIGDNARSLHVLCYQIMQAAHVRAGSNVPLSFTIILGVVVGQAVQNEDLPPLCAFI